ncbi:nucleotide 5'-monophosphate nucleosidase PpnN [Marinicella meishanensis]|uniref:nucleotide 5'-monophosphate nucleosidase PpnN n=1 Tax=Marinicella meishanensis TaxID=2873263 RepID=UPI001CC14C22|nr:nucleotide 5'-monophosphate nucleosidase PpnN [Marinicella sp. NBU2979]
MNNINNLKVIEKCTIAARGGMTLLSQDEVNMMMEVGKGGVHELFRKCCLAVLNCDAKEDDAMAVLERYPDFDVTLIPRERGIHLRFINAPAQAFVDGKMISGIRDSIFSVLRDIVFQSTEKGEGHYDLEQSFDITNFVFEILRRGEVHQYGTEPNLVVCWGGHSINRVEYQYTKDIGYQLGLRGAHICTGCGTGAMKGPMKGATVGHSKQRIKDGRYIGLTEPGIIAAEAPNPIVNHLVIMPDIEKRLEAFVRLGHGIIVFPGGVGTAEEILYLIGILSHQKNQGVPFPFIMTGPKESAEYFHKIDEFIRFALGDEVAELYEIIIDDPEAVAIKMMAGMDEVKLYRTKNKISYYFNWGLHIDSDFQFPFIPSHENMAALELFRDRPVEDLAASLRRAFSGIVAGNVKEYGVQQIKQHGVYRINGDADLMEKLDDLLQSFIEQKRMKLPGSTYTPVFEVVK